MKPVLYDAFKGYVSCTGMYLNVEQVIAVNITYTDFEKVVDVKLNLEVTAVK